MIRIPSHQNSFRVIALTLFNDPPEQNHPAVNDASGAHYFEQQYDFQGNINNWEDMSHTTEGSKRKSSISKKRPLGTTKSSNKMRERDADSNSYATSQWDEDAVSEATEQFPNYFTTASQATGLSTRVSSIAGAEKNKKTKPNIKKTTNSRGC